MRRSAPVEPARLERLRGTYALPGARMVVTSEADRLYARILGQPAYRLYPEEDGGFFYRPIEAAIDFEEAGGGPAGALVLHQNGRDLRFVREEAATAR